MGNIRSLKIGLLVGCTVLLCGCGTWFGYKPEIPAFKLPAEGEFLNDEEYRNGLPPVPTHDDSMLLSEYIARIGYPIGDSVRVFAKHPEKGKVVLYEGGLSDVGPDTRITEEPLYKDDEYGTYLFELSGKHEEITVEFVGVAGTQPYRRVVYPKSSSWFDAGTDPYSIAFYGCYAPFTTDGTTVSIFEAEGAIGTERRFTTRFEQLFAANGLGEASGLLPNLKLIVGTGDQVYVDLGYEHKSNSHHPTSAWDESQPPRPRTSGQGYLEHIDRMYRSAFSFETMNALFAEIPQINVWDDHEIRDGWGSQGDEYVDCQAVPDSKPPRSSCTPQADLWRDYFLPAKRGFIKHQYALGNVDRATLQRVVADANSDGKPTSRGRETLQQSFTVGELQGFAFDLRTRRSVQEGTVVGDRQLRAFQDWIDGIIESREAMREQTGVANEFPVIIVSSMPFFLTQESNLKGIGISLKRNKYGDDLQDGWSAKSNTHERDKILEALVKSNLRPIFVSGDYHRSVLAEIHLVNDSCGSKTPLNDCSRVWGYEILASGLRHEDLPGWLEQEGVSRFDAQRWASHYVSLKNVDLGRTYFHSEPGRVNIRLDAQYLEITTAQNFASITVEPALEEGQEARVVMKLIQAIEPDEKNNGFVQIVRKEGRWGEQVKRCTQWFSAFRSKDDPECDIVAAGGLNFNPLYRLWGYLPGSNPILNTNSGKGMAAECTTVPLQDFNENNIGAALLDKEHMPTGWHQCGRGNQTRAVR